MAFVRPLLLLVALLLSAASAPQPTYSVRRAALAPEMAPPLRSGQAMTRNAEIAVGTAGAISLGAPDSGSSGPPAGLEIPRYDLNGALRLNMGGLLDVAFLVDHGFDDGATALADDQPAVDAGDVRGYGMALYSSIATGRPGFRIAFTGEFWGYGVPWVEHRTCVDNCEGVPRVEVESGKSFALVVNLGMIFSYRQGAWTGFGGMAARNHPTIRRGGSETGEASGENDGNLENGPVNVLASAGVEWTGPRGVRLLAVVFSGLGEEPVDYAPTLALSLSLPFGDAIAPR